jgi:kumamolisin
VKSGKITQESVWNRGSSGTGGGISDIYPVPAFQAASALPASYNAGRKGRGVPDVACLADPNSGYLIVVSGAKEVVGGTSAAAPFWAGLTALINQKAGAAAGFFLPRLYAAPALTRDVIKGNNKPEGSSIGYDAGTGWDACTGLGVPDGSALIASLGPAEAADEPVA